MSPVLSIERIPECTITPALEIAKPGIELVLPIDGSTEITTPCSRPLRAALVSVYALVVLPTAAILYADG
jgi:hypothetical protein